jgi:hypothetical protein
MTSTIAFIAVAAFLSIAVLVILAILVAAIHKGDRAKNLTSASRTRTEAVTRRLLGVGIRTAKADHAAATPPGAPPSPCPSESDLP